MKHTSRDQIMKEITDSYGFVPDWLAGMPDDQLEHVWAMTVWMDSDTKLTAQQKALLGLGAATAIHCSY